ncbi:MAG: hypothetical protein NVSMB26_24490 [Beijerinckiaceae bacterium]
MAPTPNLKVHMPENDKESEKESLDKRARNAIEEARMVLPGIQALFGFQLIAALNQRFQDFSESMQTLHFVALVLIAVAIALIMTPAAYHRIVEEHDVSNFFIDLASVMIAVSMVPLMIAISIDVYLLARLILRDAAMSLWSAGLLLGLFSLLWFGFPFVARGARKNKR